jgi:3-dehydroquinate dehydratase
MERNVTGTLKALNRSKAQNSDLIKIRFDSLKAEPSSTGHIRAG